MILSKFSGRDGIFGRRYAAWNMARFIKAALWGVAFQVDVRFPVRLLFKRDQQDSSSVFTTGKEM